MLLNVSYNNPEVKRKIDTEVGPPFTIRERLKMKGIGVVALIASFYKRN